MTRAPLALLALLLAAAAPACSPDCALPTAGWVTVDPPPDDPPLYGGGVRVRPCVTEEQVAHRDGWVDLLPRFAEVHAVGCGTWRVLGPDVAVELEVWPDPEDPTRGAWAMWGTTLPTSFCAVDGPWGIDACLGGDDLCISTGAIEWGGER